VVGGEQEVGALRALVAWRDCPKASEGGLAQEQAARGALVTAWPIGEEGELCIAGPQVMKGYWNRPDVAAIALRTDSAGRSWLYTGDVARMDEDGYTYIVQRKKDMIIVSGFNVYPSEVEGVLYTHPAVMEAAVIGIPDSYRGEAVKACVVLRSGATVTPDELITYCQAQLAEFKIPCEIQIRESLPKTAVGKILHRVLREEN